MLARRFLGCIFLLTVIAVAVAFAFYQFGGSILLSQSTPKGHYIAPKATDGPDYAADPSWLAKPGLAGDPSQWHPDGDTAPVPGTRRAAIFYIHPTTYLARDKWNAAIDEGGDVAVRDALFVRSQASAFNTVGAIWAPRYRQAAFGAFLLKSDDAHHALDLAYRDVLAAFDSFFAAQPAGKPIILAGHSQGALHLSRLLADRRDVLNGRLVAAYVVGWPLSATADLPAMARTACAAPNETGCILSWQSFRDPANPALVMDSWIGTKGSNGQLRQRAEMVCVNPLTGTSAGSAPAAANLGTLQPSANFQNAVLVIGQVGARCDQGLLLIDGAIPKFGTFVLPGNNFHPFDYALFWGSVRADAERRMAAWPNTK